MTTRLLAPPKLPLRFEQGNARPFLSWPSAPLGFEPLRKCRRVCHHDL